MSSQDRRSYEADVYYDVWRSGGNPDAINPDRVEDSYYDGLYSGEAASRELRAQERYRHRHEEERAQYEEAD